MRINKYYLLIGLMLASFYLYLGYKDLVSNRHIQASPAVANNIQTSSKTNVIKFGEIRANIAIAEYKKNVVETPRGCNCGPEIDKYTESSPGQWCAMFASWVAKEAGNPLVNPRTDSWKITNSRAFTDYLKQKGTFYSREQIIKDNIQPQIGDYVVFYRGNYEDNLGHIDIVVSSNSSNGKADLIGGNYRDSVNYRKDFPYMDSYGFLGFGSPEK